MASPIDVLTSRHLLGWLRDNRLSLAFTTYQTNRLFLIGVKASGKLSVFERHFDRPMGLWAEPGRLVMSTRWQIWELVNALAEGQSYKDFDRLYVPRRAHTTGDLDAHDVAVDADGRIVFVNTAFSCLATTSERYSFAPLWQPSFISKLAPEDRCHLNGLALDGGRPAYVTAVSRSDVVSGWRERRQAGGCLIDVGTGDVITEALSMPHSPRLYRDELWLLNSGTGDLGRVDRASGAFEPVCFCPGFTRGLAFHGDHAVVGLSKPRRERAFSGLALDDRLNEKDSEARCGLYVVNTKTGDVDHWLELEGVVEELYDVQIIPDVACPTALGFRTEDIQTLITIDTGTAPVSQSRVLDAAKPDPSVRPRDLARTAFAAADTLVAEGKLEEAVALYVEGLMHEPADVNALIKIGTTQAKLGRVEPAIDCLRRAVEANPASFPAHTTLASMLWSTGRLEESVEELRAARQVRPGDYEVACQLGYALLNVGRVQDARVVFEDAAKRKPKRAEAYNGLGAIAGDDESLDEALQLHGRAAELRPDFLEAHQNIGRIHEQRGEIVSARQAYRRALKIRNDPVLALHDELLSPPIFANIAELDAYRGHVAEVLDAQAGRELPIDLENLQSSRAEPPFDWAYHGRDNLELKNRYAALFANGFGEQRLERTPPEGPPWKIGFVVTRGHEGIFSRCMSGVIQRLDPRRFQVEMFGPMERLVSSPSRTRVRFTNLPVRFDHAAATLRNAELDVIYHWEVGTDSTDYFLSFLRLAPVQCTGWGWPETSGAPELDFHLTSELLTTPGVEQRFSESLIALPELAACFPRPPIPTHPAARSRFGIEDDTTVYLCAQTLRKIHPDFDQLIEGILEGDERGVVVFVADRHAAPGQLLRERWRERLPHLEHRILMLPRLAFNDYFHVVASADVCLDPLYFGGTLTTYDALGARVPVVTLPTELPRGRHAAALCAKTNIDAECVATSTADYVDKALTIGTDRSLRAEQSRRIGEGAREIFERTDAVAHIEEFFVDALVGSRAKLALR